jgi:uncharacterized glyoxalase superfamily protein PhnB
MSRPKDYPALSPYLICPGADRVIRFAEQVLGARLLRRFAAPDGSVAHAEIRVEDSVVMIGESGAQWPSVPTHLHVYVDDVDAVYARAMNAGGKSVQEPMVKEDSDRRCGVLDPSGNTWWFATTPAE